MYRRHYRNPGPSRMPMLAWTRDLPIAGEPADVVEIVDSYSLAVEEPHPETVHRRGARWLLDRRTTRVLSRLA